MRLYYLTGGTAIFTAEVSRFILVDSVTQMTAIVGGNISSEVYGTCLHRNLLCRTRTHMASVKHHTVTFAPVKIVLYVQGILQYISL
jgi:hypothetical protein